MENKLKVGDTVTINPTSVYFWNHDGQQLPKGVEGKVSGTTQEGALMDYKVEWGNDRNYYREEDLVKVEDDGLPKFVVGQTLTPKEVNGNVLTGCAIILKVLHDNNNLKYRVLTDFGNIFTLYENEMDAYYKTAGRVENIEERINIQMSKLTEVWIKLKNGEYSERCY